MAQLPSTYRRQPPWAVRRSQKNSLQSTSARPRNSGPLSATIACGSPRSLAIRSSTHGTPFSSVGYMLAKQGALPVSMRLQYMTTNSTTNGDPRACDYWVSIISTPCNDRGVRFWFICPGRKNGVACPRRRCRKLYRAPSGHVFACRVCHELTYEGRQKSGSLFYELNKPVLAR